jgi:CheY-like chemotaxis protein
MRSKVRVLIADDNRLVADTIAMVLQGSGFESVVQYGGEEALDAARTAHFDILVTDVMMDPVNGVQTAIAFKQIHPEAKVVLVSGNERAAELLLDAVRIGYEFPVLAKPFHPHELLAEINAVSVPASL